MEGHEIFRVLSLVVVWTIPALLIVALAVFLVAGPVLMWTAALMELFKATRDGLRRTATTLRRAVFASRKS